MGLENPKYVKQIDFFDRILIDLERPKKSPTIGLGNFIRFYAIDIMNQLRRIYVPKATIQEEIEFKKCITYVRIVMSLPKGAVPPPKPTFLDNYATELDMLLLVYDQILQDPTFPEELQQIPVAFEPQDPDFERLLRILAAPTYQAIRTNCVEFPQPKTYETIKNPNIVSSSRILYAVNQMFVTNGDKNRVLGSDLLVSELFLYACMKLKALARQMFDHTKDQSNSSTME